MAVTSSEPHTIVQSWVSVSNECRSQNASGEIEEEAARKAVRPITVKSYPIAQARVGTMRPALYDRRETPWGKN